MTNAPDESGRDINVSSDPSLQASTTTGDKEAFKDIEKSEEAPAANHPSELTDTPSNTRRVTGFSWLLLVLAILSSIFLFALDNTIAANVQPAIIEEFNSASRLPWISVAYLLGAASVNLFWSQLYARFDVKWTYIACVLVFEAGSALCGGAPSISAFIVGRTLCGLFGSGMYVGVMVLFSLTTNEQERPTYFGLVGMIWGLGTVLGPIIGGAFANANAWRWAFYLNLVVGAVAGPIYLLLIPSIDPIPGTTFRARLAPTDKIGTVLMAGSLTSLLMAISFGGIVFEWSSARTIALFVVAGVLFIMLLAQQILTIGTSVEDRIFPIHFLRSPIMVMLGLATAAVTTGSFTIIYFLPLFYQLVVEESALNSGVHLLPFVSFMVVVCVGNGMIVGKYGYYMPWFLLSGIFLTIGSACLYTVDQFTPAPNVYGYSIIYGIGVGAGVQMSFGVAQMKVKPAEGGLAIGFCTFFQLAGPAVAISIANSVFLNEALNHLRALLPATNEDEVLGALFGLNAPILQGNHDVSRAQIVNVLAETIKKVYAVPLSSGALVIIMSLFMKREKLFGMVSTPGA